MPATVLALGVLSMGLLVSTRRIAERQVGHWAIANAVMDLRIRAATAHLWTEEAIAGGDHNGEVSRAHSDLGDAATLSDLLLHGGEGEGGLMVPPPRGAELERLAKEIRHHTTEWGAIMRARLARPAEAGEGSALEDQGDVRFDQLQREASAFEAIIEEEQAADLARSRRLFYGLLVAWSFIVVASVVATSHREQGQRQAEEALRSHKDLLEVMVAERVLELGTVNQQLSLELEERSKTENALRESEARLRGLSAQLLTSQETERRRISTELHDELGHALVLIKFRFGRVAKELREDQTKAKQECLNLFGFIDQTIESVRRLSRDLRPSVLEELGLAAALRWLADNSAGEGQTVGARIDDVDSLLTSNSQVVVYRIIQQALTNAARHSGARHITLSVQRRGDRVSFIVIDDGRGFDVSNVLRREASKRGLGLATMQERALMVGGSLNVHSDIGKGTLVTLGVPVQKQNQEGA